MLSKLASKKPISAMGNSILIFISV
jgi:hypothetical protein